MDSIDATDFAKEIVRISQSYKQVTHYDVEIIDNLIAKIRIYLDKTRFIDIFYNADTQRLAYALIQNEKRIFGADNTGGWHIHPWEKPQQHTPCQQINFSDFINIVITKLGPLR